MSENKMPEKCPKCKEKYYPFYYQGPKEGTWYGCGCTPRKLRENFTLENYKGAEGSIDDWTTYELTQR